MESDSLNQMKYNQGHGQNVVYLMHLVFWDQW